MGANDYAFIRDGRTLTTVITVAGVWLAALLAWLIIDAAPWIIAIILLFTLPAIWDVYSGTKATLRLTDTSLSWSSGKRHAEVAYSEIDHIRLDTRLDFTVRASAVLHTGQKIRLPQDATPPHKTLEAELHARNIKTQRHHFSLL